MEFETIIGLLSDVPLFSGLTDEQLEWLALSGEEILFLEDREIISEDESGDAAYLVLSGEAERISGPGIGDEPQLVEAGAFIGEMAMLIETEYGSTILARQEVRAIKFRRSLMHYLMEEDPRLAEHFADKIRARFVAFAEQIKKIEREFDAPINGSDLAEHISVERYL